MVNLTKFDKIQRSMKNKIILEDKFQKLELFCGCDLSYKNNEAYVAYVTVNNNLKIVEKKVFQSKIDIEYVSTYLSFREGPPIIDNFKKLENKPDILFLDGHGIAHPKKLGLATYVGIKLQVPTIGIAKNNLCCEIKDKPKEVGQYSPMYIDGEKVGYIYKSEKNSNPIFISPGDMISIESALDITKKMIKNHKLPFPLIEAHKLAKK